MKHTGLILAAAVAWLLVSGVATRKILRRRASTVDLHALRQEMNRNYATLLRMASQYDIQSINGGKEFQHLGEEIAQSFERAAALYEAGERLAILERARRVRALTQHWVTPPSSLPH